MWAACLLKRFGKERELRVCPARTAARRVSARSGHKAQRYEPQHCQACKRTSSDQSDHVRLLRRAAAAAARVATREARRRRCGRRGAARHAAQARRCGMRCGAQRGARRRASAAAAQYRRHAAQRRGRGKNRGHSGQLWAQRASLAQGAAVKSWPARQESEASYLFPSAPSSALCPASQAQMQAGGVLCDATPVRDSPMSLHLLIPAHKRARRRPRAAHAPAVSAKP